MSKRIASQYTTTTTNGCPRSNGDALFRSYPAFTCDWCAYSVCLSCYNTFLRIGKAAAAKQGGSSNANTTASATGPAGVQHQPPSTRSSRGRPPLTLEELTAMEATSAGAIAQALDGTNAARDAGGGASSGAAAKRGGTIGNKKGASSANGADGSSLNDGPDPSRTMRPTDGGNASVTAILPFSCDRVPDGCLLKCHGCNKGTLMFEATPLIPWVCGGPLVTVKEVKTPNPAAVAAANTGTDGNLNPTTAAPIPAYTTTRVTRLTVRNAFDPVNVQRYHANKDYRLQRTKSSHMIYAEVIEGSTPPPIVDTNNSSSNAGVSSAAAPNTTTANGASSPAKTYPAPHIARGSVCFEGGSFSFRVTNHGPRQPCVWCTVSSTKRNEDRSNGGPGGRYATQTITPIQRWYAPPTLPGVEDAVFTMKVPKGLWNSDGRIHQLALYREAELYRVDLNPDGTPTLRVNEATVSLPRTGCAVVSRKEAVLDGLVGADGASGAGKGADATSTTAAEVQQRQQHVLGMRFGRMQAYYGYGGYGLPQGPLAVVTLLHETQPRQLIPKRVLKTVANPMRPLGSGDVGAAEKMVRQTTMAITAQISDSPDIATAVDRLLSGGNVAVCGFGSKIDFLRAVALSAELAHKAVHEIFCFPSPPSYQHNQGFLSDALSRRYQFMHLVGQQQAEEERHLNQLAAVGLSAAKGGIGGGAAFSSLPPLTPAPRLPLYSPLRVTANHQSNMAQLLRMVGEEVSVIGMLEEQRALINGRRMVMAYERQVLKTRQRSSAAALLAKLQRLAAVNSNNTNTEMLPPASPSRRKVTAAGGADGSPRGRVTKKRLDASHNINNTNNIIGDASVKDEELDRHGVITPQGTPRGGVCGNKGSGIFTDTVYVPFESYTVIKGCEGGGHSSSLFGAGGVPPPTAAAAGVMGANRARPMPSASPAPRLPGTIPQSHFGSLVPFNANTTTKDADNKNTTDQNPNSSPARVGGRVLNFDEEEHQHQQQQLATPTSSSANLVVGAVVGGVGGAFIHTPVLAKVGAGSGSGCLSEATGRKAPMPNIPSLTLTAKGELKGVVGGGGGVLNSGSGATNTSCLFPTSMMMDGNNKANPGTTMMPPPLTSSLSLGPLSSEARWKLGKDITNSTAAAGGAGGATTGLSFDLPSLHRTVRPLAVPEATVIVKHEGDAAASLEVDGGVAVKAEDTAEEEETRIVFAAPFPPATPLGPPSATDGFELMPAQSHLGNNPLLIMSTPTKKGTSQSLQRPQHSPNIGAGKLLSRYLGSSIVAAAAAAAAASSVSVARSRGASMPAAAPATTSLCRKNKKHRHEGGHHSLQRGAGGREGSAVSVIVGGRDDSAAREGAAASSTVVRMNPNLFMMGGVGESNTTAAFAGAMATPRHHRATSASQQPMEINPLIQTPTTTFGAAMAQFPLSPTTAGNAIFTAAVGGGAPCPPPASAAGEHHFVSQSQHGHPLSQLSQQHRKQTGLAALTSAIPAKVAPWFAGNYVRVPVGDATVSSIVGGEGGGIHGGVGTHRQYTFAYMASMPAGLKPEPFMAPLSTVDAAGGDGASNNAAATKNNRAAAAEAAVMRGAFANIGGGKGGGGAADDDDTANNGADGVGIGLEYDIEPQWATNYTIRFANKRSQTAITALAERKVIKAALVESLVGGFETDEEEGDETETTAVDGRAKPGDKHQRNGVPSANNSASQKQQQQPPRASIVCSGQILILHSIDSLNAENLRSVADLLREQGGRVQLLCSFDDPSWLSAQPSGTAGGGGTTISAGGGGGAGDGGGSAANNANAPHSRAAATAAAALAAQSKLVVIPVHSKQYAFMPFVQEHCHVSDAALRMDGGMAMLGAGGGGGGRSGRGIGGGAGGLASAKGGQQSMMGADLSSLSLGHLVGGGGANGKGSSPTNVNGSNGNSPLGGGGGTNAIHPLAHTPMADTMRRVLLSLPQNFSDILFHILNLQEQVIRTRKAQGIGPGGGRKGKGGIDSGLIDDEDDGGDEFGAVGGRGGGRKGASSSTGTAKHHSIAIHTIAPYIESKGGMILTSHRLDAVLRELTSNRMAVYDGSTHSIFIPHHTLVLALLGEMDARRKQQQQ